MRKRDPRPGNGRERPRRRPKGGKDRRAAARGARDRRGGVRGANRVYRRIDFCEGLTFCDFGQHLGGMRKRMSAVSWSCGSFLVSNLPRQFNKLHVVLVGILFPTVFCRAALTNFPGPHRYPRFHQIPHLHAVLAAFARQLRRVRSFPQTPVPKSPGRDGSVAECNRRNGCRPSSVPQHPYCPRVHRERELRHEYQVATGAWSKKYPEYQFLPKTAIRLSVLGGGMEGGGGGGDHGGEEVEGGVGG